MTELSVNTKPKGLNWHRRNNTYKTGDACERGNLAMKSIRIGLALEASGWADHGLA